VLSDAAGRVLSSVVHETNAVPDPDAIRDDLLSLVDEACSKAGLSRSDLSAVGVGVQGIVDARTGTVLGWPNTPEWAEGWKGLNVPRLLRPKLGVDLIVVDDSVRAMAVTARRFGAVQGVANFLYVFLGNGIGSGISIDGRLYAGSYGVAGELGHVMVDEQGPWCSCGNRGCLEVLASTSAVLRRVRERLAEPRLMSVLREPYENGTLSLVDLIKAAHAGDKLSFQILDETGTYVGRVLATVLNLLGPEMIVLAGPLAQADAILLEAVQRQVRLRALPHIAQQVSIVCDDQGEMSGARGASLRALDVLFGSNEHLLCLLNKYGVS
jgi:predicted NBD/HSP70 family sugar kinase